MSSTFFLVSCEHGGNRVPRAYRDYFSGYEALLASHRGYDAGALAVARTLAAVLQAPLHYSTVSRLLVDLNRSPGHPGLYSEISRPLPRPVRQEILERHYLPYRNGVERMLAQAMARGAHTVHISSHSFTPALDGDVRNADIGLLYDPARPGEAALCRRWQTALRQHAPALKVRMNYPYSGRSDGLTAAMRKRFPDGAYAGIELEMNQLHALAGRKHRKALHSVLAETLRTALF